MTDSPPPQEMPADRTTTVAVPAADTPDDRLASVPPAKRPRRWPALVLGALLGAALVSAGVWIAGMRQTGAETPVVAALQSQLVAANSDRDALRRELAALRSELAQTNERVVAAARAGEQPAAETARLVAELRTQVTDLVARLEAVPRTATVDPAAVTTLERRLAAIEAAATAPGATADAAARAAAEALATRLADAERALTELRAAQPSPAAATAAADAVARQVAMLQARIDELERAARNAAPGVGAGATIVAATQLRERMRGDGPFAAELAAFRAALGRPGDTAVNAILESITPFAATGAPTAADLARDLDRAATAAQADVQADAQGWTDAVLRGVRSLVRVRRTGDITDDAGRIERAQALLYEGDVAGAVALADQASPPLRAALADWLGRARARLTLDQAGAAIAARAVAIASGAGPVAP
jgi:hypothetical protein